MTPPQLPDDAIQEILLRLPPDDPACLARATAVCKEWRHMLTNATFTARYRAFHGTPPVLGFVCRGYEYSQTDLFVSTTSFRPRAPCYDDGRRYYPHDCRDGLVLLGHCIVDPDGRESDKLAAVWDPITGDKTELPDAPDPIQSTTLCSAAVRRRRRDDQRPTAAGSTLFEVVSLVTVYGSGTEDPVAHACLYSSETSAWSAVTSVRFQKVRPNHSEDRSCFVGDVVYFAGASGNIVFRYDLVGRALSVIDLPQAARDYRDVILAPAEDGGLWLTALEGRPGDSFKKHLFLWSRETTCTRLAAPDDNAVVDAGWVRRRVIDLSMLLPAVSLWRLFLIDFADGANALFVNIIEKGVTLAIDLKSLRIRKWPEIREEGIFSSYPFYYAPYQNIH